MFRFSVALLLAGAITAQAHERAPQSQVQVPLAQPTPQRFQGIGRTATAAEIKAWDIDVRPDFAGLPKGSGSVAKGQDVWDAQCASCHGTFGESNQTFPPIVGGTRKDDVTRGRVQALLARDVQRSTMMKLSQISTLWDYINRSMPWNNPKTLTVEEVYAVTAYILNLAELVPDDFVLSDQNMAAAQQRLPNRNGTTTQHGLWDVRGKPDVVGNACMRNCSVVAQVQSQLPEHARDTHGNLALQNRSIGPVRGQVTARPSLAVVSNAPAGAAAAMPDARSVAQKNACSACHGIDNRIVGPTFREIAAKYQGTANAQGQLATSVKNGGVGQWGQIPMPAQGHVNEADITIIVQWILAGAK